MPAKRTRYRKSDKALKVLTMTETKKLLTSMVIGDGDQFLICLGDRNVPMARVTVETFDLPATS